MAQTELTPEQEIEIMDLYETLSPYHISQRLGVSPWAVKKFCIKHGLIKASNGVMEKPVPEGCFDVDKHKNWLV